MESNPTLHKNVRHTSAYMILYAVKVLIPFVTLPIYTRLIIPESFGRLALAMIYGTIISGLANFGMSLACEREYFEFSKDANKVNVLMLTNFSFTFLLFSLLLFPTIAFRSAISRLIIGNPNDGWIVVSASVVSYINLIFANFCLNYWRNEQKVKTYIKYSLVQIFIDTAIGILLVAFFRLGIYGLLIAHTISGGAVTIYFLLRTFDWRRRWDKEILRSSLKIGYPLTPRIFMGVLSTQFDKYLISLMGTMGGVGVYDIGKRLSEQVFAFMTALQSVFLPQVYRKLFETSSKVKHGVGPYLSPFFYMAVLVSLGFVLFSEELIVILFPSAYNDAIAIVVPLSISFGVMFFGKITGQQVLYARKTHLTSVLTIISILFNVALNIPFIHLYGPFGAAVGTAIASILSNGVSVIIAQRICRIDWEWEKIFTLVLLLLIGSMGVLVAWFFQVPYVWRLLLKIGIFFTSLVVGNRYGILTRKNVMETFRAFVFRKQVAQ